jgi:hypothetical protein
VRSALNVASAGDLFGAVVQPLQTTTVNARGVGCERSVFIAVAGITNSTSGHWAAPRS